MRAYKCLNQQVFESGEYKLVPIRHDDRYKIMKWRNEQLYHLRQSEPLTREKQDHYFNEVISELFEQDTPDQILFSFLKNKECIGYGGLVHINWIDKNAEISFIMDTSLEKEHFKRNWSEYLSLIEKVAFEELNLHKIYTYAFDIRQQLYDALESTGFNREASLKEHCYFEGKFIDVVFHSKIKNEVVLDLVEKKDLGLTYRWASNKAIRKFSHNTNSISKGEHEKWFLSKLKDQSCFYWIAKVKNEKIGSFRLDNQVGVAKISYLLDPLYHGKGLGRKLLEAGIKKAKEIDTIHIITGEVLEENSPSVSLFEKVGFELVLKEGNILTYKMEVDENRK